MHVWAYGRNVLANSSDEGAAGTFVQPDSVDRLAQPADFDEHSQQPRPAG
jgi:hypothetical protein